MKIALLGSAPSSMLLAPQGDPNWKIWACSPGTYPFLNRCDAFFELHRWEPGEIGKPQSQKAWFSPEYVAWMGKLPLVWMAFPVPQIPNSRALPFPALCARYGSYFWTSSLSYMLAMAMDAILGERAARAAAGMSDEEQAQASLEDVIGMYGVDMAATEEYGYQRAGCQHFLCLANMLGIGIMIPPESDLLRPMPPYGLIESTHFYIKATERKRELEARKVAFTEQIRASQKNLDYVVGALENHDYHMQTWGDDRQGIAPSPDLARLMTAPWAQKLRPATWPAGVPVKDVVAAEAPPPAPPAPTPAQDAHPAEAAATP